MENKYKEMAKFEARVLAEQALETIMNSFEPIIENDQVSETIKELEKKHSFNVDAVLLEGGTKEEQKRKYAKELYRLEILEQLSNY